VNKNKTRQIGSELIETNAVSNISESEISEIAILKWLLAKFQADIDRLRQGIPYEGDVLP
jgi:hypothetical protein